MHLVSDPEIVIDQFGCEQDLHQPTHSDSALPTDPENRVVQPLSFLPTLTSRACRHKSARCVQPTCCEPAADDLRPPSFPVHSPSIPHLPCIITGRQPNAGHGAHQFSHLFMRTPVDQVSRPESGQAEHASRRRVADAKAREARRKDSGKGWLQPHVSSPLLERGGGKKGLFWAARAAAWGQLHASLPPLLV